MQVKKEGATAAGALLGVNVACAHALITSTATTQQQHVALLCCSVAIPLLSYGVSVELLKLPSPSNIHAYMLFVGAAVGIAGFGFTLAAASLTAGFVFGTLSVVVIGLTAIRTPQ